MATIQNDRDKLLQAAPVRFVMPSISPDRIPGLPGAFNDISQLKDDVEDLGEQIDHLMNTSASFSIRTTDLTFVGAAGTTTPATITLTAERGSGLVGGTIVWSVYGGVATISPLTGNSTTVTGSTVAGGSVTIRARLTIDTAIYDAYVTLERKGALSAVDQVNLTNQVTGQLAHNNVSGLGALALLNTVNLNTQTTGALNGLTQVTNLGALAYANSIAANQIGAGTLAAGVIYAGEINADNITSGTITGRTMQTAASGANRVVISSDTNDIRVWRNGDLTVRVGTAAVGYEGEMFVSSTSHRAVRAESSVICAIHGDGVGSATGVIGQASLSGTGHGVHGLAGLVASGIVGHRAGYNFYASGSGIDYGPFTGAHDAIVHNSVTGYELGDIMVDVRLVTAQGISETLFEVMPSSQANQTSAIGVCARIIGPLCDYEPKAFVAERIQRPDTLSSSGQEQRGGEMTLMCGAYYECGDDYTYIAVNSLGEGQINVCGQNGNLQAGDLIVCSDMPGKGMRQGDDIVRAHTVARVRVDVEFDGPDDVKLVPCIYLCG